MASEPKRKDHPLSMRLPESDIAIIDRAAEQRGRSRTDFVRDAAVRAAEDVIMENVLIRMSPEGFNAFKSAIDAPAVAVPQMVELLKRKTRWPTNAVANKTAPAPPNGSKHHVAQKISPLFQPVFQALAEAGDNHLTTSEIKKACKQAGAKPWFGRYVNGGFIKRVRHGVYTITEKGRSELARVTMRSSAKGVPATRPRRPAARKG
jgi:uncharacterized protein (DUF1778 family)